MFSWDFRRAVGHCSPLQSSCLENPHGQRSLAGYSPWGHKESDTTEHIQHVANGSAHVILFLIPVLVYMLLSYLILLIA